MLYIVSEIFIQLVFLWIRYFMFKELNINQKRNIQLKENFDVKLSIRERNITILTLKIETRCNFEREIILRSINAWITRRMQRKTYRQRK